MHAIPPAGAVVEARRSRPWAQLSLERLRVGSVRRFCHAPRGICSEVFVVELLVVALEVATLLRCRAAVAHRERSVVLRQVV